MVVKVHDLPVEGSPYRVGKWTVMRLKAELQARNSPTSGSKQDLIQRLERLDGIHPTVKESSATPTKR